MRIILSALILLSASTNAFASSWMRCTAVALANSDSTYPEYLQISPSSKPVIYDYKRGSDKKLYLAVKVVGEPLPGPHSLPQYGLEQVQDSAQSTVTVSYSSTFNGEKLEKGEFSLRIFETANPDNTGVLYTAVPTVYLPRDAMTVELETKNKVTFVLTCTNR